MSAPTTGLTTPPAQQLVDGKLVGASDGTSYPILNPATGEEIGQAPDATAADVDAAIAAARRAFDESDWSTDVGLRLRCLRQLHDALLEHPEASTMEMRGRGMHGWLRVDPTGLDDAAIDVWVRRGIDYAASLPPK